MVLLQLLSKEIQSQLADPIMFRADHRIVVTTKSSLWKEKSVWET